MKNIIISLTRHLLVILEMICLLFVKLKIFDNKGFFTSICVIKMTIN